MTKISAALAAFLVLASASSNVAFAASPDSTSAFIRGQVVDRCRVLEHAGMDNHHARLAVDACVQRLLNRSQ